MVFPKSQGKFLPEDFPGKNGPMCRLALRDKRKFAGRLNRANSCAIIERLIACENRWHNGETNMNEADRKALDEYLASTAKLGTGPLAEAEKHKREEILKKSLSEDLTSPGVFCRWLREACKNRDGDALDETMLLGWILRRFDGESVKVLEGISLENWVKTNNLEDMVELIERYGGEETVNVLASMAIQKYPGHYLGEDDEHITRKAIWSLHRLYREKGNAEALEKIRELSGFGDLMVEGLAKHHLEKLGVNERSALE